MPDPNAIPFDVFTETVNLRDFDTEDAMREAINRAAGQWRRDLLAQHGDLEWVIHLDQDQHDPWTVRVVVEAHHPTRED